MGPVFLYFFQKFVNFSVSDLPFKFRVYVWGFSFFLLILVMAIGGRPEPELCFLPGRLRLR